MLYGVWYRYSSSWTAELLKMGRIGCLEMSVRTSTLRCVISQKIAGLNHTAEEVWNEVHSSSYKYKGMATLSSTMPTLSRLKFTDIIIIILLFTMCVYASIQTPHIEVFDPEKSSRFTSFYLSSFRKMMCTESTFTMITARNEYTTQQNAEIFHVKGFGL